ncbi:Magnesium transporter protein 1 [Thelohanellus kitauei]|uniref:Magnesium transporter protein 1 n=1 Tax=Thelohanellus kitauei TaxID=669202 RepID=A0A0C2JYX2_THEKT|nr:Magnesium transporter protein 1 [Thelohanellus kitauei]
MSVALFLLFCLSSKLGFVHSNHKLDNSSKYDQLVVMAGKSPFITLDTRKFEYFTSGSERNYSVIVYFKLSGYNIPPFFSILNNNLQTIADSSRQPVNYHITNVFFAKIVDNQLTAEFCNKFKFPFAPIIVHFPPNGQTTRKDFYDFRRNDGSIEQINFWVKFRIGAEIQIVKPLSYIKIGLFIQFLAYLYFIYSRWGNQIKIIHKRKFWGAILMILLALLQAGFMFVYINDPPFMTEYGNKVKLISDHERSQHGVEVFIVASLYCSIAYCLIELNNLTTKKYNGKSLVFHLALLVGFVFALIRIAHFKAPWII